MSDLAWTKSSLSYANGDCLEIASLPGGGIAMRDSKDPGAVLHLTATQWEDFLGGLHLGDFNPLRAQENAQ